MKTECNQIEVSNSRERQADIRGTLIMFASVGCFTVTALLLRYLGSDRAVAPAVSLLFRAICGSIIVVLFFRSRRPLEIIPIFTRRALVWRGITGIIGTAAFYVSIVELGAGKATLICNTYVLFAALFAAFFIGEKLGKLQFAWMLVAFVGVVFLLSNGQMNPVETDRPKFLYELIGLTGAFAAASTVVLIRQLTVRYSNGTIFMAQCLWVGLSALPFALVHLVEITLFDVVILSLAGFTAGFGQLLMNEGYRRLTVTKGSAIQIAWPLLTTIGGFFLFGETLSILQLTGGALILLGTTRVILDKCK